MKRNGIVLLITLFLLLVSAGCGKDAKEETDVSSAEATPTLTAQLQQTEDGETVRYENMYFALSLPEEEEITVSEERSSEYYMVTLQAQDGKALFSIELTARSRELTDGQAYYGELFVPGDQGHLNIIVTKESGVTDDFVDEILDTMEPCGEFDIRINE